MNLTVDVITRTRNRPTLLKRAIRSVTNQSFKDWTHIIVNDCGDSEPVEAIVRELDPEQRSKTKIVHNQVSRGIEGATNLGISNGTGELVTLLDDDDTWHPNFLATSVEALDKSPQFMGVVTQTTRIEEKIIYDRIVEINRFPMHPPLKSVSLANLLCKNLFTTNSFIYRRPAWEVVGPYREDLPVLGDWEFNIRFLYHFDVTVIPYPLALYHTRRTTVGSTSNSVIAKQDLYEQVRSKIFNEYLRQDLVRGTIGIGVMAAICQSANAISGNSKQRSFSEKLITYITRRVREIVT